MGLNEYISLINAYMAGTYFGFHLTYIEIIRNLFFVGDSKFNIEQFYILASLIFIFPIVSNLIRTKIYFNLVKWTFIIYLLHFLSFCLIFLQYISCFYLTRVFAGLAVGFSTTVIPEYLGKLKSENRGFYVYMFQASIIVGILLGQICTFYVKTITVYNSIGLCALFIAGICALLTKHMIFISEESQNENNQKSIKSLFSNRSCHKSITLALIIHLSQQLTCINGIIVYTNTLLEKEYGSTQSRTILIGFFSLCITLLSSYFIERLGRKILIQLSFFIVMLSLGLLLLEKYTLFSVLLFQFGYSIGLGPVTWLLTSEIFPFEYQSIANPLCSTINWLFASLTVLFFEYLLIRFGINVIIVNIIFLGLFSFVIQIYLTETKNRIPDFQ